MKNYYSTKTEAIADAKSILRIRSNRKRLDNLSITPTHSSCGCGQTKAYNLTHITNGGHGRVESIIVAICKSCA